MYVAICNKSSRRKGVLIVYIKPIESTYSQVGIGSSALKRFIWDSFSFILFTERVLNIGYRFSLSVANHDMFY